MRATLVKTVLISAVLALSSCLVPENFTGKYTLSPKGDYTFTFEGTMVNVMVRQEMLRVKEAGGQPDPRAESMMREMAEEFKEDPRVREIKQVSPDTYKVHTGENGNVKELLSVPYLNNELKYWTLVYNADGKTASFIVEAMNESIVKFDQLGITPSGKLQIDTSCAIISSTVKLDKSFFGNTYSFAITRADLESGITIVFQLAE